MTDRWAAAAADGDDLWADSPSPVAKTKSKKKAAASRRRGREKKSSDRRKSRETDEVRSSISPNVTTGRSPTSPSAAADATAASPSALPSASRRRRSNRKENATPAKLNSPAADSDGENPNDGADGDAATPSSRRTAARSRGIAPSKFHRGLSALLCTPSNNDVRTTFGDHDDGNDDDNDDETPRASGGGGAASCDASAMSAGAAGSSRRPPLVPPTTATPSSASTTLATPSSAISPPPTALSRLHQILSDAQMRILQNRRREITTRIKIRRAAFRDVTELRTWPLQELALGDLDRLLDLHLGSDHREEEDGDGDGDGDDVTAKEKKKDDAELLPPIMSGFASDSSGISTSSIDEPKRSRRGGGGTAAVVVGRDAGGRPSLNPREDLSPGKATLRARYVEEFRYERSLGRNTGVNENDEDTSWQKDEEKNKDKEQGSGVAAEAPLLSDSDDDSSSSIPPSRNNNDLLTPDSTSCPSGACETDNNDTRKASDIAPRQEDFLPALWCVEPRIFAVEKSATGKRRYLVGHLGRFMDMYWRKSDSRRRHYYELIREGTPCRLFLDLEFTRAANPHIDDDTAEQLVTDLIEELCVDLRVVYGHSVDRSAFVDLDSCTEKKFSRHLILHLPNQGLFVDAPAAGSFIRHVVGRLAEEIATGQLQSRRPTLAKHLFVHTKVNASADKMSSLHSNQVTSDPPSGQVGFADDTTCFVDMGVYTRNRLFRLLGSAKYGKPSMAALRIASANTFPFPPGFGNDKFYVPDQERVAECGAQGRIPVSGSSSSDPLPLRNDKNDGEVDLDDPEIAQFLSSMDWSAHADALALTLVVPINYSKIRYPILQGVEEAPEVSRNGRVVASNTSGSAPTSQRQRNARSFPKSSVGTSPFPSLDDYVANELGSRGGSCGSIRAWSLDDSLHDTTKPCYITYHMKDNRFCERIGRQHKSNNVMWTVDLERLVCYQTCHDPECRAMGFRGELAEPPCSVQEQVREVLFNYELAALDEQAILGKADRAIACSGGNRNSTNAGSVAQGGCDAAIAVDEEFEKALLALDISGRNSASGQDSEPTCKALGITAEATKSPGDKDEFDIMLSQALLTNPELFP